jgi:hypothetical protein
VKIHKKQKKSLVIGILLIIFVLATASLFVYWNGRNAPADNSIDTAKTSTRSDIDYSPPTEEQVNGGESAKKDLADQDSTTPSGELQVELSAFKKADGKIHVTANIQGLVTSDGNCELSVKKGSDIKKQQSGIAAVTDYSTCKGFDVTDLSSGLWQIQINITSGNKSGSSSTDIEV